VIELENKLINKYEEAANLHKLLNSNLIVFTHENDDGHKILKSELGIAFLNDDKKIMLKNSEKRVKI